MKNEALELLKSKKRPLFVGRQLHAMKIDLALRVANKKLEMEQMFAKYGAVDEDRVRHAQEKRQRKAARRLKEKQHE